MTRAAPLAQSYRKPRGTLTCVGYDGLTWAGPKKAVRPCTRTALKKKKKKKKKKWRNEGR